MNELPVQIFEHSPSAQNGKTFSCNFSTSMKTAKLIFWEDSNLYDLSLCIVLELRVLEREFFEDVRIFFMYNQGTNGMKEDNKEQKD